MPTPGPAPHLR